MKCFRGKAVKFCEKVFCAYNLCKYHASIHGKTLKVLGSSRIQISQKSWWLKCCRKISEFSWVIKTCLMNLCVKWSYNGRLHKTQLRIDGSLKYIHIWYNYFFHFLPFTSFDRWMNHIQPQIINTYVLILTWKYWIQDKYLSPILWNKRGCTFCWGKRTTENTRLAFKKNIYQNISDQLSGHVLTFLDINLYY